MYRLLLTSILVVHPGSDLSAAGGPVGEPPALAKTVRAPGGYPGVPSEPALAAVEQLSLEEVRALAESGREDASIQWARLLWMGGNRTQPLDLLRKPAQAGSPVAKYLLGTYLRSTGGDPKTAAQLLSEAAHAGHAIAQETLAGHHERGTLGFTRSDQEAFAWYLPAARQGLRHAQLQVGLMLCQGRGVKPDKSLGRRWVANSQQGVLLPVSPAAAGCDDASPAGHSPER